LFDLKNIKVLHIEPTTVCNADCPQCARGDPEVYIDHLNRSELTLDVCQELFKPAFIKNLDKMFMCGNFGDPAAGAHTIEIYKYFREHNPNIVLGMNSNGSIRATSWWQELGGVFSNPYDYVVFSIDGLEDTNSIYRRNTVWSKIIENAQAFISAGGTAHWDMLIYEHNQHQIAQAESLAADLGFSWFRTKVSKRFKSYNISFLNPPKGYTLPNVVNSKQISCHALNEKSIYVSANGKILPCCWFGAEIFTLDNQAQNLLQDWNLLASSWSNSPHRICQDTCSIDDGGTSFSNQWQYTRQLK